MIVSKLLLGASELALLSEEEKALYLEVLGGEGVDVDGGPRPLNQVEAPGPVREPELVSPSCETDWPASRRVCGKDFGWPRAEEIGGSRDDG